MTTATLDPAMNQPGLSFAKSESKAVGMDGGLMNYIRENAPRVVGSMKLVGDAVVGMSLNPLLMGYSAFAIVGRLIMIGYGTKANQKQAAEEAKQQLGEIKKDDSLLGNVKKMAQPKAYPIESSAGFSVIAETFGVAFGISQFFVERTQEEIKEAAEKWVSYYPDMPMEEALEKAAEPTGYTPLILGIVAIASYANMFLSKEKDKNKEEREDSASLKFAESTSKPQGWFGGIMQKFKDRPVFTSSLVNSAISVGMMVFSYLEKAPNWEYYMGAGAIFLAANLLMATAVSKKEFNVEGAEEELAKKESGQAQPKDRLSEVTDMIKQHGSPQLGLT